MRATRGYNSDEIGTTDRAVSQYKSLASACWLRESASIIVES